MDLKICSQCKLEQPITNFYNYKASKDGHMPACKKCLGAKQVVARKIYNEKYKDQIKAREKSYRLAHPKRLSPEEKARRKEKKHKLHPLKRLPGLVPPEEKARRLAERRARIAAEKIAHPKPSYYETHREEILARAAVYREAHRPPIDPAKEQRWLELSIARKKASALRKAMNRFHKYQADPSLKLKHGMKHYVSWVLKPMVLERDKYSCQMCGSQIRRELVIHHILPVSYAPERIEDFENLITLCKECHQKAHGQYWADIDLVLAEQLALVVMVKEQLCVN